MRGLFVSSASKEAPQYGKEHAYSLTGETPKLRSTKVLIVGKGSGWEQSIDLYRSPEWNVWTIPQSFNQLDNTRVDLVFEVHQPSQWKRKKNTLHTLNTIFTKPKLIVPQRYSGWTDNSYLLPVNELQQEIDIPYVNSFSWMIAYAIYRKATHITLRGVNLDYAHEALQERDGVIYALGYARALGIILDVGESGLRLNDVNIWSPISPITKSVS